MSAETVRYHTALAETETDRPLSLEIPTDSPNHTQTATEALGDLVILLAIGHVAAAGAFHAPAESFNAPFTPADSSSMTKTIETIAYVNSAADRKQ